MSWYTGSRRSASSAALRGSARLSLRGRIAGPATDKGVAPPGITVGMIYRAAIPYVWLTMLMMALIFIFPSIVTAFVTN